MRDDGGRLLRTFNRGRAKQPAFLEDHAYLLEALVALYEATFEERWYGAARRRGRHAAASCSPTPRTAASSRRPTTARRC